MEKIKVENPIVELDGDEMTRIIWAFIKEQLILPYLDLELEYFDLSIESRDATDDQITVDAANAIKEHGVGVKCATITPDEARVEEFGLKRDVPVAERDDPQHPRRRDLPRADRDLEHPAAGPGLDEADHHRPPRLRRPVPGRRTPLIPGEGKLTLNFTPKDGGEPIELDVFDFPEAAGSRWRCTTSTTRSATSPAPRFATGSSAAIPVYMSTKNTILKTYDGRFKDLFAEIFEDEFEAEFEAAGLTYEHRLIDDMVAAALKWEGGYVWACKNYDGDVQSDTVAQGFGSLGLMTSVLMTPDGKTVEAEAPTAPSPGTTASTRRASRPRPTRSRRSSPGPEALAARGRMDETPEVTEFAETLERVCVETVESGKMTKDLALLVGPDQEFQTTQEFLASIDENLQKEMN